MKVKGIICPIKLRTSSLNRIVRKYGAETTWYHALGRECVRGTVEGLTVYPGVVKYTGTNGTAPVYHFHIQDHLGNNRVVAGADGTVEQVNHYYPYGGLMADICTGSDVQRYKYNGKELDRMHGLDWHDYGARHYDANTGRWPTMDKLAEESPEISPYVYCHNNPINKIDADGMDDYSINLYGRIYFENKTKDEFDKLIAINDNYIILYDKNFLKGFMTPQENYDGVFSITSSRMDAANFFKFASDNTIVKWGMDGYQNNAGTIF